ncbi:MAG: glycosyltransferase family 2 protein [Desulfobulbus sp.]|jgi:glycosyltransferase involved in cell wall biosynthesis
MHRYSFVLPTKDVLKRLLGIRFGRLYQYAPKPLSVSSIKIKKNNNDDLPSILIVTPSFNQVQFVAETVQSVLEQTYPDLEYIVQDACSTDGTADILHTFLGKGVDIRIEPDKGQTDALNKGFARTTGEIMGYLNSDDLLLPGILHFVGQYFRDNPDVDVIYGNRLIVDAYGREVGRWILPGHDQQLLRYVDYVPQESMFWRRRIWDRIGGCFDARLHFAMDWDLIVRFLDAGAVFRHLPELFGVFRAHGTQKTQVDFAAHGAKEIADIRERYPEPGMKRLARLVRHGQYLLAHRRADAAFAATLCTRNNT